MVRGDGRITYTRRHAYHTQSNKAKVVKTPGGKLVAHYNKKSAKGPRCMDCGISLPGVRFWLLLPSLSEKISNCFSRCSTNPRCGFSYLQNLAVRCGAVRFDKTAPHRTAPSEKKHMGKSLENM